VENHTQQAIVNRLAMGVVDRAELLELHHEMGRVLCVNERLRQTTAVIREVLKMFTSEHLYPFDARTMAQVKKKRVQQNEVNRSCR
jgi:hypothetical protein